MAEGISAKNRKGNVMLYDWVDKLRLRPWPSGVITREGWPPWLVDCEGFWIGGTDTPINREGNGG